MSRFAAVVLLILALGMVPAQASSVEQQSRITIGDFATLLPGKFVDLESVAVSKNDGYLFMLVRDKTTRDLEWDLVDPFEKRVVAQGTCPFKAFTHLTVAPDAQTAGVFAEFPTSFWTLRLSDRTWKMSYRNGSKGATIISQSPLTSVQDGKALSLLDFRDAQGFVIDTVLVNLGLSPFFMEKVVGLAELKEWSIKQIFKSLPDGLKFYTGFVRMGEDKTMVYILQSKKLATQTYTDYLMQFVHPNKVEVLAQIEGGRILPLDYHASPRRVLYRTTVNQKAEVLLRGDGEQPIKILSEGAVAGSLMKDDMVGLVVLERQSCDIYIGKAGTPLARVFTSSIPYAAEFTPGGNRLVLLNRKEIRCFKIIN